MDDQIEYVRAMAELNRNQLIQITAVWAFLSLKGIVTSEDQPIVDQAFALAVSEADQRYEQHVRDGMESLSEDQRTLLRKALGLE